MRPGRYLASFNIAMDSSNPAWCGLSLSNRTDELAFALGASDGLYVGVSATAPVTVPAGSGLRLDCGADVHKSTFLPKTVTLIPLGRITNGSVSTTPARSR